MPQQEPLRLHLGCGSKYLPDYVHVDAMPHEHVDHIAYIDDLHMFEDNTAAEVYACHCLEHFHRHDIEKVLREWYRVLAPGGLLRIAVPDFEAIAEEYLTNHRLEQLIGLLHGGQSYEYNMHYCSFDFASLSRVLQDVGFCDVTRYDWRTFLPEGFDDFSRAYLPHMDFDNGRLMSLNVVAKK